MPSAAPKIVSAEVVATQPTEADKPLLARLSGEVQRRLPAAAFIVKIRLNALPEPTGDGWALYVGETRIPKYWEYPGGIYFKVLDDSFLTEHRGEPLRFSHDDRTFVNTGVNLPGPDGPPPGAARTGRRLPLQSDVLREAGPARAARPGAARATKKGRTPRARPRSKAR
jgi:hypothetical protein